MSCHNREVNSTITYMSPGIPMTIRGYEPQDAVDATTIEIVNSYSTTSAVVNAVHVFGAESQIQALEKRIAALEATIQRHGQYCCSHIEAFQKNQTECAMVEATLNHTDAYAHAMELIDG